MDKRWLQTQRRLFGFALVTSLMILVLGILFILWPNEQRQPLQSLDLLDLRDNSAPLIVPLLLQNTGWLPLYVDTVNLDGEGLWRLEAWGWLPEAQTDLGPVAAYEGEEIKEPQTRFDGGQNGQMLLNLTPNQKEGEQQLKIEYHTFIGIRYTLLLDLQTENLLVD